VKPDSTVDNRRVTVERTQGSETVVSKGLTAGEQVVTDGQPRLTPGAKVEVRTPEPRGGGQRGGAGAPPGAGGGAGSQRGGGEPPAGRRAPAGGAPPAPSTR
jgi:membrane fusion protein, multidrug efflux system